MGSKRVGLHGPVTWRDRKMAVRSGTAEGSDPDKPGNTIVRGADNRVRSKRTEMLNAAPGSYTVLGEDIIPGPKDRTLGVSDLMARLLDEMNRAVSYGDLVRFNVRRATRDSRRSLYAVDVSSLAEAEVTTLWWRQLARKGFDQTTTMSALAPILQEAIDQAQEVVDTEPDVDADKDPVAYGYQVMKQRAAKKFLASVADIRRFL